MPQPIKVHSQHPPGWRCTLYALYAEELSSRLGLEDAADLISDLQQALG